MGIVNDFFSKQESLYNYFGIPDGPVVYPIEDRRMFRWEIGNEHVFFGYGDMDDMSNEERYHSPIVTDEKVDESIREKEDFTAILTTYSRDGKVVWAIFDNAKKELEWS